MGFVIAFDFPTMLTLIYSSNLVKVLYLEVVIEIEFPQILSIESQFVQTDNIHFYKKGCDYDRSAVLFVIFAVTNSITLDYFRCWESDIIILCLFVL
jgi:hypothetical protein